MTEGIERESMTTRLDINPQVVAKAKVAYARQKPEEVRKKKGKVHFRDVMDHAIDEYLPEIEAALGRIGLERKDVQNRQRPVTRRTWERLDAVTKKLDISKVQLVRCALDMLGRSADDAPPISTDPGRCEALPSAPNGDDGGT